MSAKSQESNKSSLSHLKSDFSALNWTAISPQKNIFNLFHLFLSNYTRYCQLGMRNWFGVQPVFHSHCPKYSNDQTDSNEIDSNFTARHKQDYSPWQRQATNNQANSYKFKTLNWIY